LPRRGQYSASADRAHIWPDHGHRGAAFAGVCYDVGGAAAGACGFAVRRASPWCIGILLAARADGLCDARFMDVRPDAGPSGGATVRLSAVEVRALFNILGLVAAGGSLTEKPERDMAGRLQGELERALGD
jgi:hypothetical protein